MSPPSEIIFGGAYYRRLFAFRIWEAYIWRGLFSKFYDIEVPKIVVWVVHFSQKLSTNADIVLCGYETAS